MRTAPFDTLVVRRTAAAGDVIQAAPIAQALSAIGLNVLMECNLIFLPILKRMDIPCSGPNFDECDIDLDGVYESRLEEMPIKSIRQFYIESASDQLSKMGYSVRGVPSPRISRKPNQQKLDALSKFDKPWTMISPRSCSPINGIPRSGQYNQNPNRTVPDSTWEQVSKMVPGTCFWMAMHSGPPNGIMDLKTSGFESVIEWAELMDVVATVDTGVMHIAGALGIPTVAVMQAFNPERTYEGCKNMTVVKPDLECLGCCKRVCPINAGNPPCQQIDPGIIADAINRICSKDSLSSTNAQPLLTSIPSGI